MTKGGGDPVGSNGEGILGKITRQKQHVSSEGGRYFVRCRERQEEGKDRVFKQKN